MTYVWKYFQRTHSVKDSGMTLLRAPFLNSKPGQASQDTRIFIYNLLCKREALRLATCDLCADGNISEAIKSDLSQCHSYIKPVWTCSSSIREKTKFQVFQFSFVYWRTLSQATSSNLHPLHCFVLYFISSNNAELSSQRPPPKTRPSPSLAHTHAARGRHKVPVLHEMPRPT